MQARRAFFVLFAAAASLIPHTEVAACAVCLSGAAGGDRLIDAFNWSVIFLMGAPYAIFGAVAGRLFYIHRRAARDAGGLREAPPPRLAWVSKGSER